MPADNTHHLIVAAERRPRDTRERDHQALRELAETGQRLTVTAIAAHAASPAHGSTLNPTFATRSIASPNNGRPPIDPSEDRKPHCGKDSGRR